MALARQPVIVLVRPEDADLPALTPNLLWLLDKTSFLVRVDFVQLVLILF